MKQDDVFVGQKGHYALSGVTRDIEGVKKEAEDRSERVLQAISGLYIETVYVT